MYSVGRRNIIRRFEKYKNEESSSCEDYDNISRLPKDEGAHVIYDVEQRLILGCLVY
jgi:hypothetical protein